LKKNVGIGILASLKKRYWDCIFVPISDLRRKSGGEASKQKNYLKFVQFSPESVLAFLSLLALRKKIIESSYEISKIMKKNEAEYIPKKIMEKMRERNMTQFSGLNISVHATV